MPIKALLKFRNIDSTKDLNDRMKNMFSQGFVADTGTINSTSITGLTVRVTINPFSAVSQDGIVFYNEENTSTEETVTLTVDGWYLTYFEIIYLEGNITTANFKIKKYATEALAISAADSTWVKHAIFEVSGGVVTPASLETTFDNTDRIDKFSRNQFKGTTPLVADFSTWDNTFYRTGDMVVALDNRGLYILRKDLAAGTLNHWYTLGVEHLELCLGYHRGNGTVLKTICTAPGVCFDDEKHMTEEQYTAMSSGTAIPPEEVTGLSGGNPVVGGKYPLIKLNSITTTLTGIPAGTTYNGDVDILITTGHVFTGLGDIASTQNVFLPFSKGPTGSPSPTIKPLLGDNNLTIYAGCKYSGAYYAPSTKPLGTDDFGFLDVLGTGGLAFHITLQFTDTLTLYENTDIIIYYGDKNDLLSYDTSSTQAYESLNNNFNLLEVIKGVANVTVNTDDLTYIPDTGVLTVQDLVTSIDNTFGTVSTSLSSHILSATVSLSSHITTVSGIATMLPDVRDMPTTGVIPYTGWSAYQQNAGLTAGNSFFSARVKLKVGMSTGVYNFFEVVDRGQVLSRHQRSNKAPYWYRDSLGSPSGAAFVVRHDDIWDPSAAFPPSHDQGFEYRSFLRLQRYSFADWNTRHPIEDGPDASSTISSTPTMYTTTITNSISANSMYVNSLPDGFNFSNIGNYIYIQSIDGSTTATACNRLYKGDFWNYGFGLSLRLSLLDGSTEPFFAGYSGNTITFYVYSPQIEGSIYEHSIERQGGADYDRYYHTKHLINLDNLIVSATYGGNDAKYGAGTLYVSPTWREKQGFVGDPAYPEHERYSFLTRSYNAPQQLAAGDSWAYAESTTITSYLRGDGCFNVEAEVSGNRSLAGGCYLYGERYDSGKFKIEIPGASLQPSISAIGGDTAGDAAILGTPILNKTSQFGIMLGVRWQFMQMTNGGAISAIDYSNIFFGTRLPLQTFTNNAIRSTPIIEECTLDFITKGTTGFGGTYSLRVYLIMPTLDGSSPTQAIPLITETLDGTYVAGNRYIKTNTLGGGITLTGPVYIAAYIISLSALDVGPIELLGITLRGTLYEPRQLG